MHKIHLLELENSHIKDLWQVNSILSSDEIQNNIQLITHTPWGYMDCWFIYAGQILVEIVTFSG